MHSPEPCPECGSLAQRDPQGFATCPRCLLEVVIDRSGHPETDGGSDTDVGIRAGTTVSHYRLVEPLGRGGMGVVYRAEDTELEREVALKFLPQSISRDPRAVARFRLEARATAALSHPNICSIHDIGTHRGTPFLVMELLEGSTLAERLAEGPLPAQSVLDLALQITDAVGAAHQAGIVHRDIKPANIFVTRDDRFKVLDFGLAKWMRRDEAHTGFPSDVGESDPGMDKLTDSGSALGTVAYMAPEQVLGRTVDERTDLFAIGHVLYEAATGRTAFSGFGAGSTIDAILHQEVVRPSMFSAAVSPRLDTIISKLLSKSPDYRYGSASQLRDALNQARTEDAQLESLHLISGVETPPPRAIAVLPFKDMSPSGDQEYFCDGLTEELISSLSRLKGLSVASSTSAFTFKGTGTDVRKIGRKLGVEAVLEGSVRKIGTRLRVTVQLVNVTDGYQMWSERYDRVLDDVFVIYDDVAQAVLERLEVTLAPPAGIVKRYTGQIAAYNAYLKGRYFWNRRNRGLLEKAIHYFEEAISIDPSFALAHTGLADSYTVLGIYSVLPPQVARARVDEAVSMALSVDCDLVEACNSKAMSDQYFDWDWEGARQGFLRSIALQPSNALSRGYYAVLLTLCYRNFDEARLQANLAQEIDPVSVMANTLSAIAFYYMGDYSRSIRDSDRALEIEPDCLMALWIRGCSLSEQGKHHGAVSTLEKAVEISDRGIFFEAVLGVACCRSGDEGRARTILDALLLKRSEAFVDPFLIALVYEGLGERDAALDWLDKAYQERSCVLCQAATVPHLAEIRQSRRGVDLLRQLRLPTQS